MNRPAWTRGAAPWRILFQAGLILGLGALVYLAAANAGVNLARQSISSGFGFLRETSGFGIIQTLIPYSEQSTYGEVFLVGLLNTLAVAVIGILGATACGVVIGIAGVSRNLVVSTLASAYVEIMRNVPLLLHLFFWYFAVIGALPAVRKSHNFLNMVYLNNRGLYLPWIDTTAEPLTYFLALVPALLAYLALRIWGKARFARTGRNITAWPIAVFVLAATVVLLLGAGTVDWYLDMPVLGGFNFSGGVRLLPEFVALLLALVLYTAAFIGEIVRAGINAVPGGQMEAARALGLSRLRALKLVILPQALRLIIPPLTSQCVNLTKNSSLAVAIAYPDLVSVFAGTALNQTGQAVEILLITLAVYLVLSLLTSGAMNLFNARITNQGARHA